MVTGFYPGGRKGAEWKGKIKFPMKGKRFPKNTGGNNMVSQKKEVEI